MSLMPITKHPNFPATNNDTRMTGHAYETQTSLGLEEKRNAGFWFRKWCYVDMVNICWLIAIHVLASLAPFVFDLGAFLVCVGLALFTGLGVALGYHRLLTHKTFIIPKWLEYFFAYCGAHAFQRDPIYWVSIHKNHHKYSDTEKDPHSPIEGFWFSHIGWLCYNDYTASKCGESRSGEYSNVPELKAQWFYRFLQDTYFCHPITLGALLYFYGGLPYLVWGMGMRTVIIFHITFIIGSFGHSWGKRPWNTPDTSTNNWWLGVLAFGEGWHNNHHAFPKSARTGLEWWQIDLTWEVIKFLESVGLATDVKSPSEDDKRRMALFCSNRTNKLIVDLDHDS